MSKKTIVFSIALASWFFCCAIFANVTNSLEKPKIFILATGGTIAGKAKSSTAQSYDVAKVSVQSIIDAVPELSNIATISGEQLAQIDSSNMTTDMWLKISKRVNELLAADEVCGVVITHGTDTLEETAYFLNLTVKSKKPVVVVGAMRPFNGMSADGALNLFNAVAVAAYPDAKSKGVMVVMNDNIYNARDVTKTNTTNVDTFKSPNGGMLGYVHNAVVAFYHTSLKKNTWQTEFDSRKLKNLPKVDIVYSYINEDPSIIRALIERGAKGIVVAGTGDGNISDPMFAAIKDAIKKGVVIVRSSRTGSGRVALGVEKFDEAGVLVADDLNPQKARILLAMALTKAHELKQIQSMFDKY